MGNYGKFGKKLLLENYVPFSLISWHSNWASYARGWGFLLRFFDPGPELCTEKLSRGRDFDSKN